MLTCSVTVSSRAACVGAPVSIGTLSGETVKPDFSRVLLSTAKVTPTLPVSIALNLRTYITSPYATNLLLSIRAHDAMARKQSLLQSEAMGDMAALFNPKMSILIQKCHPYTRNLTQKRLGSVKTHFNIREIFYILSCTNLHKTHSKTAQMVGLVPSEYP